MDFPKVGEFKVDSSNLRWTLIIGLNLSLEFRAINHITSPIKWLNRVTDLTSLTKS